MNFFDFFSKNVQKETHLIDNYLVNEDVVFALIALDYINNQDDRVLIVTPDEEKAESLAGEITVFLKALGDPSPPVIWLPQFNPDETVRGRYETFILKTIVRLQQQADHWKLFVTAQRALLSCLPSPQFFTHHRLTLEKGQTGWSPHTLAQKLVEFDYDHEIQVCEPGDFAVRGGILDVYPPQLPYPARIEFWGDEIESIRFFDPQTQRSTGESPPSLEIFPLSWQNGPDANHHTWLDYIAPPGPSRHIYLDPELMHDDITASAPELNKAPFRRIELHTTAHSAAIRQAPVCSIAPLFQTSRNELIEQIDAINRQLLCDNLQQWLATGYRIFICLPEPTQHPAFRDRAGPLASHTKLNIIQHEIPRGFIVPSAKMVFLSSHEVFGQTIVSLQKRTPTDRIQAQFGEHDIDWWTLQNGTFVVHAVHG
ncbi:MAG: hypothetical protein D6820_16195, partial [Lentisphaerae bacterium]